MSLLLTYQLPDKGLIVGELQNTGHALIFCIISFSLAFSFGRTRGLNINDQNHLDNNLLRDFGSLTNPPTWRFVISIFIICMTIGGAVELVQNQIGRKMTWSDLGLDALGTSSGLLAYLAIHEYRNRITHKEFVSRKSIALLSTAGTLLILAFTNPIMSVLGLYAQDKALPVLFDAESFLLNRFISSSNQSRISIVSAPINWVENTTFVARADYPARSRWPIITLQEPVQDWSNYQFFYFEIFAEKKSEKTLTLRVHDKHHNNRYFDRFNKNLRLKEGLNRFSIALKELLDAPKSRSLDLQNIEGVSWFFDELNQDHVIYFDNIGLRKEHHLATRS